MRIKSPAESPVSVLPGAAARAATSTPSVVRMSGSALILLPLGPDTAKGSWSLNYGICPIVRVRPREHNAACLGLWVNQHLVEEEFLRTMKVVVGVTPLPLLRAVEHLFRRNPAIQIVARPRNASMMRRQAGRFSPDMIIVHQRLLGKQARETIAATKRNSPGSKLILVRCQGVWGGRRYGADANLAEGAVVRTLLVVLKRLAKELETGSSMS